MKEENTVLDSVRKNINLNRVLTFVGVVTLLCTLGLLFEALATGSELALNSMSNIAMIGMGGLLALLGIKNAR